MTAIVKGRELYEIGKERWFQPEEIYDLLVNFAELGYKLCPTRVTHPEAGSFYLFHRLDVPDFKSDDIEWEKKKSSQTVNEQYLKLLIKGVHVISGQYATSSIDNCFRRRTYRLADPQNSYIHLVHYRNCEGDAYVRKSKKKNYPSNSLDTSGHDHTEFQPFPLPLPHLLPHSNQFDSHQAQYPIFDLNSAGCPEECPTEVFSPSQILDLMEEEYDDDYQDLLLLVSQPSEVDRTMERTDPSLNSNPNPCDLEDSDPFKSSTSNITNSTSFQFPQLSTIKILDFVPTGGNASGGEKMLICLEQDVPSNLATGQIQVIFSPVGAQIQHVQSLVVSAELLTANVIRLLTPVLTSPHLRYVLIVCSQQGVMISLPSGTEFTYTIPTPLLPDPSPPSSSSSSTIPSSVNVKNQTRTRKRDPSTFDNPTTITTSTDPSDSNNLKSSNEVTLDASRIHKIRIVEKLLTHNSLPSPISPNLFNFNDSSEDDWLDDKSLSLLSSSDLEKLMDKYLFNVVNQLVQLAISDDDLKAELDHLDSSGYSLLHYCCLFNLTSLVEILLTKGANINLLTGSGSTALHLAADAGHYFIVQQLTTSGADITLTNRNGLTPAESAFTVGQPSLPSYWHMLSSEEFPSYFQESPSHYGTSPNINLGKKFTFDQSFLENSQTATSLSSYSPRHFRTNQDISSEDEESSNDPNISFSSVKELTLSPTISRRPSSVGLDPDPSSSSSSTSLTTNANITLLQGAVSALSLADKCALSLSLGNSRIQSPADLEVQSVLSEYDKESLDVAMSMMGPMELGQVENEVRIIQNGVRTWLLRKNYINLRDAAKTLQIAWRGRRNEKQGVLLTKGGRRTTLKNELETINECQKVEINDQDGCYLHHNSHTSTTTITSSTSSCSFPSSSSSFSLQESHDHEQQLMRSEKINKISNEQTAAATLQAATRGMLARKEFHHIKRQTMASLVIQKSLLHWWMQKGSSNTNSHEEE